MKSEKQILNFGKKLIREETSALTKVQKNLNINFSKAVNLINNTKGNIVLNHCELNSDDLSFICDANPYKYNRFTPGSNIKIISKKEMRKKKPKYLLVLIWSFRSEVIRQELNFIKNGGKLIFHLPIFHVIDKTNYKNFLNKNNQF